MPTLTLLGDSVIDNAAYIEPGEPDVAAQIAAALPDWRIDMRAVDGSISSEVAADGAALGDAIFLSSGGNDALGKMHLMTNPMPILAPFAFARVLAKIRGVREAFRAEYVALLERIAGRPILVATIYNPHFTGADARRQVPGEGGLSAYNDVIQQEALARGHAILDLRRLFDAPADYANPIEPSAIGGAKIAARVADWCRDLERVGNV